jgi:oxepin-CoA hydrolase/3-oxo-5,6-dehydrosuberyl-CoA semialdehyde dehydrogenase
VAANYGLEECRFLRPLYHNDTIYVRLTCKQKVDRDQRGAELPSGIVKWYGEVFDAEDELVAIVTVLTLVQKKQTVFTEMTSETIRACLEKLTEDSKPLWGSISPQRMIEHLEYSYRIASGEIQDFEISTPEQYLERTHDSLYNYRKMPRDYDFPLAEKSEIEKQKHDNLTTAKEKMWEAREEYLTYFKENPDARTKNPVFGELNKFEWYLQMRKHLNHHFEQFDLV